MPVTVVIGGQYGSEGKGKIAHYLAKDMKADAVARVGGPNSGHTIIKNGKTVIYQQLPTATALPDIPVCICAGSYIDLKLLTWEIAESCISSDRLIIDPYAIILQDSLKEQEAGLMKAIGSTGSGTGAGVQARISRSKGVTFAKDIDGLKNYIGDVKKFLRQVLSKNGRVIIEGTQGFGLSLFHSGTYPFVTGRDTTAAAFISEAGLSPLDVDDIVMVLRTFPIRVAGESGPLYRETSWEDIGVPPERTSVTKNIRRVGQFDIKMVMEAADVNRPTRIAMNHLDYIGEPEDISRIGSKVFDILYEVESNTGVDVKLLGFGKNIIFKRI